MQVPVFIMLLHCFLCLSNVFSLTFVENECIIMFKSVFFLIKQDFSHSTTSLGHELKTIFKSLGPKQDLNENTVIMCFKTHKYNIVWNMCSASWRPAGWCARAPVRQGRTKQKPVPEIKVRQEWKLLRSLTQPTLWIWKPPGTDCVLVRENVSEREWGFLSQSSVLLVNAEIFDVCVAYCWSPRAFVY